MPSCGHHLYFKKMTFVWVIFSRGPNFIVLHWNMVMFILKIIQTMVVYKPSWLVFPENEVKVKFLGGEFSLEGGVLINHTH